jgi:hypothetical protein
MHRRGRPLCLPDWPRSVLQGKHGICPYKRIVQFWYKILSFLCKLRVLCGEKIPVAAVKLIREIYDVIFNIKNDTSSYPPVISYLLYHISHHSGETEVKSAAVGFNRKTFNNFFQT